MSLVWDDVPSVGTCILTLAIKAIENGNRHSASRRSKGMDHAKLIAVRMEEARDARGISVAELARRASIDRKRLWYILDGQRQMRADEFVRLCAVMGLDMQFFLTPELREELSYRRKLTIEEYGTGLCGLPTMRERGETRCNI